MDLVEVVDGEDQVPFGRRGRRRSWRHACRRRRRHPMPVTGVVERSAAIDRRRAAQEGERRGASIRAKRTGTSFWMREAFCSSRDRDGIGPVRRLLELGKAWDVRGTFVRNALPACMRSATVARGAVKLSNSSMPSVAAFMRANVRSTLASILTSVSCFSPPLDRHSTSAIRGVKEIARDRSVEGSSGPRPPEGPVPVLVEILEGDLRRPSIRADWKVTPTVQPGSRHRAHRGRVAVEMPSGESAGRQAPAPPTGRPRI